MLIKKLRQYFCTHDWTCRAEQGIPPPRDVSKSIIKFLEYATMYCSKCGEVSELSINRMKTLREEEAWKILPSPAKPADTKKNKNS